MTITIDEAIKNEIAQRLVEEQAHPGYASDYQGQWYVVNGKAVMHAERNRQWNPWQHGSHVISVEALIFDVGGADEDHASFTLEEPEAYDDPDQLEMIVEWALSYVPDAYECPHTR